MSYSDDELQRLHAVLYELLGEIIRVCDKLDIPYFIIGGTAIGAFFEEAIIPWDDDMDIGMTRRNYERFLREAPAVLGKDYFLQHPGNEPNTPFFFAKLRKRGTTFAEHQFFGLDIHHGIYVDIFPFDLVPDNQRLQKVHREWCNFLNGCFMGKSIWQWAHIRKCEVDKPRPRGFIPCLITWLVDVCLPKRAIYSLLNWSMKWFNGGKGHTYYNLVLTTYDHIRVECVEHPEQRRLGPLTVWAPSDLEPYLRHHYPRLRRHIPKEEQINHRPDYLDFEHEADKHNTTHD